MPLSLFKHLVHDAPPSCPKLSRQYSSLSKSANISSSSGSSSGSSGSSNSSRSNSSSSSSSSSSNLAASGSNIAAGSTRTGPPAITASNLSSKEANLNIAPINIAGTTSSSSAQRDSSEVQTSLTSSDSLPRQIPRLVKSHTAPLPRTSVSSALTEPRFVAITIVYLQICRYCY